MNIQKRSFSSDDEASSPSPKQPKVVTTSATTLVSYETQLLTNGRFSDVTVGTGTKQYQLHRVFLARSPYFHTLFTGTWSDNKESIDLKYVEKQLLRGAPQEESISETVWDALFHYFYTDTLPDGGGDQLLSNVKQIQLLIELLDFFDLPTDSVVEALDPVDAILIHYRRGKIPDDFTQTVTDPFRDMILNFIASSVEIEDKIELVSSAEDGFIEKLITIPLIPLKTKAMWLKHWIQHNLKIQISSASKNSSWRDLKKAEKYVKMVDSLKFNWVQEEVDKEVLLHMNLFSSETMARIEQQKGPITTIPDDLIPNSFHLDDMEIDGSYRCGPIVLSLNVGDRYSDDTEYSCQLFIKKNTSGVPLAVTISTRTSAIGLDARTVVKKWNTENLVVDPGKSGETIDLYTLDRQIDVVLTIIKVATNC